MKKAAPPTYTQRIIDYVQRHPGVSNRQIASALALEFNLVAALTGGLATKKNPVFKRAMSNDPRPVFLIYPIDAVTESPKPAPAPLPVATFESGAILDAFVEQFSTAVAQQIAARVKEKVLQELEAMTLPQVPAIVEYLKERIQLPDAAPAPVTRKPSVVICGLLPQQAGIIASEFATAYNLSFWKEEGTGKLRDMAKNADHILTFSGKMGHHVENTIKSVGKEFVRVMGGLTSLRQELATLGERRTN